MERMERMDRQETEIRATAALTPGERIERERYAEYDRERALRLSRVVGLTFIVFPLAGLLGLALYLLVRPGAGAPQLLWLAAILAGCIALYLYGVWLAGRRRMLLAASVILASTVLSIAAFQVAWQSLRGVDALIIASFGAYVIVIGLAGVMGNVRYMFTVTALITGLVASIGLVLPRGLDPGYPAGHAIVVFLIVSGVYWMVAILVYGSSVLYARTVHELGDIRLAFERAQRLDELKDQFITNVNHELRSPAMAMQGYLELLRLKNDELAPERRAALIEKACRAGDDLVALITNILDIQRLDESAAHITPVAVNIRETVETAARLIDPREGSYIERDLRLDIPEELSAWCEPFRLQQILVNLLSNAVKYSAPGTPVVVRAWAVAVEPEGAGGQKRSAAAARQTVQMAQMVEISVRDEGLGIPPDQMPLLFNRFARLPRDLASNVSGNGLGLHLCRTLAEAMGGRIRVESTGVEGEGATFYVHLPLPPTPVDAPKGRARTTGTPAPAVSSGTPAGE
jgi:signal transduction histidine kinase